MIILERICDLIKNFTKNILMTGVLIGASLGVTGCVGNSVSEKNQISSSSVLAPSLATNFPSINKNDSALNNEPNYESDVLEPLQTTTIGTTAGTNTTETPSTRKNPSLTTTVYGEGGNYFGNVRENPFLLNVMTGYNILDKSPKEGVLYLPNFRMSVKTDRAKNVWNNYVDLGLGVAYQKNPFIIGAEAVHREAFKERGKEGDFLRLWGGYWSMWEKKPFNEADKNPNRLWGTRYGEIEYNTLEKNLVATGKVDAVLDIANVKGFIIGPYVSGKLNMDAENEYWNRFGEVAGGIRIRKGAFNLFLEAGTRKSFNGGSEGPYTSVSAGFWFTF